MTKRDKLDQTLDLPGSTSTVQNYNDEMDRRSERLLDDSFDLATKEGLTNVETEAIPEFESVTKQNPGKFAEQESRLDRFGNKGSRWLQEACYRGAFQVRSRDARRLQCSGGPIGLSDLAVKISQSGVMPALINPVVLLPREYVK